MARPVGDLRMGFTVPRNTDDLIGMGRSFARTLFYSAGNITHDPAYGHLIAMGILTAVQQRNVSENRSPTPNPIAG